MSLICAAPTCSMPSLPKSELLDIGHRTPLCERCLEVLCLRHVDKPIPFETIDNFSPPFSKEPAVMIRCEYPCLGISWKLPPGSKGPDFYSRSTVAVDHNPTYPACLSCHREEFCYRCIIEDKVTFIGPLLTMDCEHKVRDSSGIDNLDTRVYRHKLNKLQLAQSSRRNEAHKHMFGSDSPERHFKRQWPWQQTTSSDDIGWLVSSDEISSLPSSYARINRPVRITTENVTQRIERLVGINTTIGRPTQPKQINPIVRESEFSAQVRWITNPFMKVEYSDDDICKVHNQNLIHPNFLKLHGLTGEEKLCIECSCSTAASKVTRLFTCPCGRCGLVMDTEDSPNLVSDCDTFCQRVYSVFDLRGNKSIRDWTENVGCLPHLARKGIVCPYALSRNVIKVLSVKKADDRKKADIKNNKRKHSTTEMLKDNTIINTSDDNTSTTNNTSEDNTLMTDIKCCVCLHFPYTGHIFSCGGNGHTICSTCISPSRRDGCIICASKTFTRSLLAEKVRSLVTVPCPNTKSGCNFTAHGNDMEKHVLDGCMYREVPCIMCETTDMKDNKHGISVQSPEWPDKCHLMSASVPFGLSSLDPIVRIYRATSTATADPFLLPTFTKDWILRWTCKLRDDESTTFVVISNTQSIFRVRSFSKKPEAMWLMFSHITRPQATRIYLSPESNKNIFPHTMLEQILSLPCKHKNIPCYPSSCPSAPIRESYNHNCGWMISLVLADEFQE